MYLKRIPHHNVQSKVNEPITRMNRHNTPIIKKEKEN